MSIQENTPVSVFTREAILAQNFGLSPFAKEYEDQFTNDLNKALGTKLKRYEVLRLFLGRSIFESDRNSLSLGSNKEQTSDKSKSGSDPRYIKGEFLFGNEDLSTWASIIVIDGQLTHNATMADFKGRVEMHLDRGAQMVHNDLEENSLEVISWLRNYSRHLSTKSNYNASPSSKNEVILRLGEVSQLYPSKKLVEFSLNRVGKPPHIALMGATSKGKTTTGIQMAKQIVDQSSIPILLIDPKGEFVQNGKLSSSIAKWNNSSINPIQAGEIPIPLDFLPNSGIGDTGIQNAAMRFRDSIALCCKSIGEVQRDRILQVIEKIIRDESDRSLDSIKDAYFQELTKEGLDKDSVHSRLNELTSFNIFKPIMSASDFFSKSWVISLASVESEELKKLIVMLLLDAAKTHLLRLPDSEQTGNIQSLRNLIVIDEARRVMASNKSESLADLVRQGRSKGVVIMLLSQDPTDFQGEADDFLSQIGTCVAFACQSGDKGLAKLKPLYGQKLLPANFSDVELTTGLAYCKWPDTPAAKVRCWGK